jgi:hypothetical protein
MRKRGSIVCKSLSCLPKGPTISARMRTVVTAALQRQYLQTEVILWICLVNNQWAFKGLTAMYPVNALLMC